MTLQAISALNQAVPFAKHVGLVVTRMDADGSQAVLPDAPHLLNHVASQHAGALFTLGEAASGAAMIQAFGDLLAGATPLVRDASISYRKVARGQISAIAAIADDKTRIRDTLASDGRVDFTVNVSILDEAPVEVATMVVQWSFRTRR